MQFTLALALVGLLTVPTLARQARPKSLRRDPGLYQVSRLETRSTADTNAWITREQEVWDAGEPDERQLR